MDRAHAEFFEETANVRPLLMPVVQFPDGDYHVDSTPIMRHLDARYGGARSACPADAATLFLNDLVEDFADEWLTKSLFHYRFGTDVDSEAGAAWVMDDAYVGLDAETLSERVRDFVQRQHARKALVGATPANAALFENCYLRVMALMERWVATDRFAFGSRPATADFALYGQLRTLATDPTPAQLMRTHAPRLRHWLKRVDDLSGVDGEWDGLDAVVDRLEPLLELSGTFYLPFLKANFAAVRAGASVVEVELAGHQYAQAPFRYQAKCYAQLVAAYDALPARAREALQPVLARTGCEPFLTNT